MQQPYTTDPATRTPADSNGATSVLRAAGVSKAFTKRGATLLALDDVSLEVGPREFVALVGPSGCGKSTLLRIVAGLAAPTAGSVTLNGAPVSSPSRAVGIMFQQATLFPWKTILSNVLLPTKLQRKPSAEDRRAAESMLAMVGLGEFIHHYPRELSGGMQQRAALARVLLGDPSLLLLDEPFGALDEFTREKLNLELTANVARSNAAVILVTHNINEAIFLADRVVTMSARPGRIRDVIEVDFPRPRELSLMETPQFQSMYARVRKSLDVT